MAPSFITSIRRRSRFSFRTDKSTDESSSSDGTGTAPTSGSLTPPSLATQSDLALNLMLSKEPAPSPCPASSSRESVRPAHLRPVSALLTNVVNYSVPGMAGLGSPPTLVSRAASSPSLPVSQYAPRITNLSDNAWVFQRLLLVRGIITEPAQQILDGTLTVSRLDDYVPPTHWPVCASQFKALVYLLPGPNRLRFDFSSPRLANSASSNPIHASYMTVHMLPPTNTPPLQLAVLLARDSPGFFDTIPPRAALEGNGLDIAIAKFRMAAYLWQAFAADQLARNRLGRRAFRFDDEWTTASAHFRDRDMAVMRSEARVHVVRSQLSLAELRALPASDLLATATAAVRSHLCPRSHQRHYVALLILDTHFDLASKALSGHVEATAGPFPGADLYDPDLHLAVFGSHALQFYPSTLDEIVPAFSDRTPTAFNLIGSHTELASSWESASAGIGAHLRQVARLFGASISDPATLRSSTFPDPIANTCHSHTPEADYHALSRVFVTREASSGRLGGQGGLVRPEDEPTWHRLDCLRLRAHHCFRLPQDPPPHPDQSVQVWPVEGGTIVFSALSGMASVELLFVDPDRKLDPGARQDPELAWIEYPIPDMRSPSGALNPSHLQKQVVLSAADIRSRLPDTIKRRNEVCIGLIAISQSGGSVCVPDVSAFAAGSSFRLPTGKLAFRSYPVGRRPGDQGQCVELTGESLITFTSATRSDRIMARVFIHTLTEGDGDNQLVAGIEFGYDDDSTQILGCSSRGPLGAKTVFELDVRKGEYISGIFSRSGDGIEAVQILTSLGRKSPMFGNPLGGSPYTLVPPRGYTLCGVGGSFTDRLQSLSAIIAR